MTTTARSAPYDAIAHSYDSLFGDSNPYYQPVTACEREAFEAWVRHSNSAAFALDIGCGTGLHTGWLLSRGYTAIGIDNSAEMIGVAIDKFKRCAKRVTFHVVDAFDETPLTGIRFAVVCCLGSTLNHLPDWRRFARVVSDRLVDGGVFVFSYDNVAGVDMLARILMREYEGYSTDYVREIILPKARALVHGEPFRNYWRVHRPECEMEVGLTYERTKRWVSYLRDAHMEVRLLRGVHLVDCWSRPLLRASAGKIDSPQFDAQRGSRAWLTKIDRILGHIFHNVAANVVGVAVKESG